MKNRIEILSEKKLIGMNLKMSLVDNKTFLLWSSFRKRKAAIENAVGSDMYSMQVYDKGYYENFNPGNEFVKWAGVEVSGFENIPDGMESYILKGGKYVVFDYKGNPKNGGEAFKYIFQEWFPLSEYVLDDREHFEILGEKYKNDSDESEEEIWIPIK
ncbi:GyrI-like domain-containing protein [uncultured Flavobacterium sp.]|uniref:GyrI-like domain-containing protein n=1 Tax=uncultured Flavobacterium sp. TaxID=165435 RepID=UPI0025CB9E4E|nr:GyrI-like domain-containing protein [uncultured Flavobacterium sp.]